MKNYQCGFKPLCHIPAYSKISLRTHSDTLHCALLIESGVHIKEIQERLRHKISIPL